MHSIWSFLNTSCTFVYWKPFIYTILSNLYQMNLSLFVNCVNYRLYFMTRFSVACFFTFINWTLMLSKIHIFCFYKIDWFDSVLHRICNVSSKWLIIFFFWMLLRGAVLFLFLNFGIKLMSICIIHTQLKQRNKQLTASMSIYTTFLYSMVLIQDISSVCCQRNSV